MCATTLVLCVSEKVVCVCVYVSCSVSHKKCCVCELTCKLRAELRPGASSLCKCRPSKENIEYSDHSERYPSIM